GLSRTEIRDLVSGKVPAERIDASLSHLDLRGLAHEQTVATAGRYAHTWYPGRGSEVPGGGEERGEPEVFATPPQALPSPIPGGPEQAPMQGSEPGFRRLTEAEYVEQWRKRQARGGHKRGAE